MDHIKNIYIPKWAGYLYILLAGILIPWTVVLANFLPSKHLSRNWDVLWVGFDTIMLLATLLTLYYIIRRKIWVIISASALATLFIIDAWFDILTSRTGREQQQSIIMGCIEIILAILTYYMVYRIIHQTSDKQSINFHTKKTIN